MSKAMSQEEVAFMFTDGWVCFRAFDPETRAPMLLPHFLMPSIPTTTTSTWKNKTERAAIKAAKLATMAAKNGGGGGNNTINGVYPPYSQQSPQQQQQQWINNNNNNNNGLIQGGVGTANDPLNPLVAVPKRKKKKDHSLADGRFDPMYLSQAPVRYKPTKTGTPMTQEAMDAKSGKGRSRRRTFGPIIKSSQKCGNCKSCLNPGWKKPCDVRRAEMLAQLQEEQNQRHEQEQLQQQQQVQQLTTSPPPPAPVVVVTDDPVFTPTPAVNE